MILTSQHQQSTLPSSNNSHVQSKNSEKEPQELPPLDQGTSRKESVVHNIIVPTQPQGEPVQSQTPVKPALPIRKTSIQIKNGSSYTPTERRSIVPQSADHYRVQLIEKDTQLRVAHKETERLTGLLTNMEEEMRKIRRENMELVKLHGIVTANTIITVCENLSVFI